MTIEQGNFATAGYVDFKTKSILEENQLRLESGSFGRNRALAMFNLLNTPKQKAYFATEALFSEGYFDAPQDFERLNVSGKYRYQFDNGNALTFSGQYFDSSWDASGQIPERAVTSGLIGRFGAIDATEGGNTTRTTLGANYVGTLGQDLNLDVASYWSYYDFQLFSNFTFFLNDPEKRGWRTKDTAQCHYPLFSGSFMKLIYKEPMYPQSKNHNKSIPQVGQLSNNHTLSSHSKNEESKIVGRMTR